MYEQALVCLFNRHSRREQRTTISLQNGEYANSRFFLQLCWPNLFSHLAALDGLTRFSHLAALDYNWVNPLGSLSG